MDYLSKIEQLLGSWKRLPEYPFHGEFDYAVFPSLNDELVDEVLYEAIFEMNEQLGNREFIFKAFVDVSNKMPDLLVQTQKCWKHVDKFQASNLVYEGFYTTGDRLNWLGIYHPDDYFVVGAKKEILEGLCLKLYGHLDWNREFVSKYEDGHLEMYSEDFEVLNNTLIKKGL